METQIPPDIRIGTLAGKGPRTAEYIRHLLPMGFESFQINFFRQVNTDLSALADELAGILAGTDAVISSLGIYGNTLGEEPEDEITRQGWRDCIDAAASFGCDVVCGFAGRVRGRPVPESMERFHEVFTPLAERAGWHGVRIAFENCPMGGTWKTGDWNIAFHPAAWELMFESVPSPVLGLEWEPCHQMCQLIDPMPQLRQWVDRIYHVHGKDAKIYRDVIDRCGVQGPEEFAFHKHPGLGESNWARIVEELRKGGFRGSIDIEGWHDDVYRDDLELTGQVMALDYLKRCRGRFVPNPPGF
jgi:sugar phosphate isomerase/epimerase